MNDEGHPERLVLNATAGSRPHARAEEWPSSASVTTEDAGSRRPYAPPELEALGRFRALTLQQSVPIGPGD